MHQGPRFQALFHYDSSCLGAWWMISECKRLLVPLGCWALTEWLPCGWCSALFGSKWLTCRVMSVSRQECPGWRMRQTHKKVIPDNTKNALKDETMVMKKSESA